MVVKRKMERKKKCCSPPYLRRLEQHFLFGFDYLGPFRPLFFSFLAGHGIDNKWVYIEHLR